MNDKDRQLVELITRQVTAALAARNQTNPGAPSGTTTTPGPPASIHAPAGVCTGDYSKFTELAGRIAGASPPAAADSATKLDAPAEPAVVAVTGIVTASRLQDAIAASPDGVAQLAADARLTPLANDFVRLHPEKVQRHAANADSSVTTSMQAEASPWLWWIDGHCPAVRDLQAQRNGTIRIASTRSSPAGLRNVVRELATAIKSRRVAGGVLFVHNAARVMCFANRCPSIRAILGNCGEAVEQGIRELGANVLVLEYPHLGPAAMTAMVDRMLQQAPKAPPSVERELADLHRCG